MTRKLLPTLPRFEPENMDHTATKCFKECPRKYFYRMVLGRTSPAGKWESVFAWGSAIHKFLEVLYETRDAGAAMQQGLTIFRAPSNPSFEFQSKERLITNFAKLLNMYKEETKNGVIRVEAIEQPFNMIFADGISIGGRFDQLIRWNGRTWIRDWKTTSKQLSYFKQGLEPNDQAIRYVYAASCLQHGMDENGYPNRVIDGVLFTAIYNTKTVVAEIQGVPSSRTLAQVRKWVDEQVFIHKQMAACREADVWPMHEVSCSFCDYRQVCTQPSEAAMENMLKSAYLLQPWKHEEVEQQKIKE
jgi:hypothetical protein